MTTDPIIVLAIFVPAPGAGERLRDVMREFIPQVHAEAGCDLYCIQEDGDTGRIVMFERWATEHDLDMHTNGRIVAELNAALDGLLVEPPAVTRLRPIPIGDPRRGAVPAAD
ncbi:putative quinol monooxygenase [Microbacterium sp.]|uniref:putative quinol monooxygenase n=1 Tax=Microbacterium sp. TaxID=51671 RepID=UPI003A8B59DE